MIVYYDADNQWLCFKMQPRDWRDGKGHRFLEEVKIEIPDGNRQCEEYGKELLWKLDAEYARKWYELFKRYYPAEAAQKQIKIFGELQRRYVQNRDQ